MLEEEIIERERNKIVGIVMMVGAVLLLLAIFAFMFWPRQTRGQCLIDMAEKARGNSTIFATLAHANCSEKP